MDSDNDVPGLEPRGDGDGDEQEYAQEWNYGSGHAYGDEYDDLDDLPPLISKEEALEYTSRKSTLNDNSVRKSAADTAHNWKTNGCTTPAVPVSMHTEKFPELLLRGTNNWCKEEAVEENRHWYLTNTVDCVELCVW